MRRHQGADALGLRAGARGALEPRLELDREIEPTHVVDHEAGCGEKAPPVRLGVVAHVGGIADPLGLLRLLPDVEVVDDDHALRRHTRELAGSLGDVCEMVCCDARRGELEARVCERQVLGEADDVRLHAGRGVAADHLKPRFAQAPRDVAAAGRHVDRGRAARRPFDDQVEIGAGVVRRALAVQLGALAPDVAHTAP